MSVSHKTHRDVNIPQRRYAPRFTSSLKWELVRLSVWHIGRLLAHVKASGSVLRTRKHAHADRASLFFKKKGILASAVCFERPTSLSLTAAGLAGWAYFWWVDSSKTHELEAERRFTPVLIRPKHLGPDRVGDPAGLNNNSNNRKILLDFGSVEMANNHHPPPAPLSSSRGVPGLNGSP